MIQKLCYTNSHQGRSLFSSRNGKITLLVKFYCSDQIPAGTKPFTWRAIGGFDWQKIHRPLLPSKTLSPIAEKLVKTGNIMGCTLWWHQKFWKGGNMLPSNRFLRLNCQSFLCLFCAHARTRQLIGTSSCSSLVKAHFMDQVNSHFCVLKCLSPSQQQMVIFSHQGHFF